MYLQATVHRYTHIISSSRGVFEYATKRCLDVFALGSLLYNLITGVHVWDEWLGTARLKQVRQMIIDDKRPKMKRKIRESTHPANVALITAYDMCTHYDPDDRSSVKEVSSFRLSLECLE